MTVYEVPQMDRQLIRYLLQLATPKLLSFSEINKTVNSRSCQDSIYRSIIIEIERVWRSADYQGKQNSVALHRLGGNLRVDATRGASALKQKLRSLMFRNLRAFAPERMSKRDFAPTSTNPLNSTYFSSRHW